MLSHSKHNRGYSMPFPMSRLSFRVGGPQHDTSLLVMLISMTKPNPFDKVFAV